MTRLGTKQSVVYLVEIIFGFLKTFGILEIFGNHFAILEINLEEDQGLLLGIHILARSHFISESEELGAREIVCG